MEGTLEEADIRLQRAIHLHTQASQQLTLAQTQQNNTSALLQALRKEHASLKQSFLISKVTHFNTPTTKLAALITAAQNTKQAPQPQPQSNTLTTCDQGRHLLDIFSQQEKEQEQAQIRRLQEKLAVLYSQVGKCVEEEMLNEKVMARIKKEARRAAKLNTLQMMEKQISKRQGWLQDSKNRINNNLALKEVQQKVVHNLESLKLLMNKKVIANDYVYDHFAQTSELHALVNQMGSFRHSMQIKSQLYAKALEESITHSRLNSQAILSKQQKPPQVASFNRKALEECIHEGHQAVEELQNYNNSLLSRCHQLQLTMRGSNFGSGI